MPANINSYVQRQGTAAPWWSNGEHKQLAVDASIEEWMEVSGLDYPVQLRKLYMRATKADEFAMNEIAYRAVVNGKTGFVFQVAGQGYKTIQNKEIVSVMRQYVEAGEMTMDTMGSLGNGAVVWGLAKVDGATFELPGGDKNDTYLLMATSHDGTLAYSGMLTSVRVVCQNTLRMAQSGNGKIFKLKHTKNADLVGARAEAKKVIELSRKATKQFAETAGKLVETKITEVDRDLMVYEITQPTAWKRAITELKVEGTANVSLDSIIYTTNAVQMLRQLKGEGDHNALGREILEALMTAPGARMESARGTAWGMVNAVSYYTDHHAGKDASKRLQSAWMGRNADIKDMVLERCLMIAERV